MYPLWWSDGRKYNPLNWDTVDDHGSSCGACAHLAIARAKVHPNASVACSAEQRPATIVAAARALTSPVRRPQMRAVKEAEEKADQELDVLLSDLSGLIDESMRPKAATQG